MLLKAHGNDFPPVLGSNCLMYANDLKILIKVRSDEDVDDLSTFLGCCSMRGQFAGSYPLFTPNVMCCR